MNTLSRKNITYTVQPIQGIRAVYNEGDTLRIVFRGADSGQIDLRQSTLNFQLTMPASPGAAGTPGSRNPPSYNESVASIFQVQSVSLGGQQLNFAIGDVKEQLIRKVRARLTGNNGQYLSGIDFTHDYIKPNTLSMSATEAFSIQANSNFAAPNTYLSNVMNQQKADNIMRHYIVSSTDGTFILNNNTTTTEYSIKMGDLVPELLDFAPVDSKILLSLGLEIQLRLLPFNLCMSYMNTGTTKTGTTLLEDFNLPVAMPVYSIKDVYCGVVNIQYSNPMNDRALALVKNDIPYQTFHYLTQAIQNASYNAQWGLQAGSFVSGIFLCFTAKTPYTMIVSPGTASVLTTRNNFNEVPRVLPAGSAQYCYALDIKDTQLQVNNVTYPAALAPYDRALQKMQTSAAFSEIMFGKGYQSTLPQFMSYDFIQFIPIMSYVEATSLFQLYQTYTPLVGSDETKLQVNIITVCDRTLSLESGMVVLR